ncbi:MAG: 2,3-bisphosphoglycerate-independent phosphoglycerate mutase [Candidatus Babeliaceae bacterium]|jgi:2,3-bisphosphoglycerate-independent phosphoglycerate mutase
MKKKKPTILIILDGWGHSTDTQYNAIYSAHPEFFNNALHNYKHTFLLASGCAVGLLDGMIGNSEVGHMTIGAGRIIEQAITQLHKNIDNKSFFDNNDIRACCEQLKATGKTLHIMGLLSNSGVHCDEKILFATIQCAYTMGAPKIIIHPFLDGRDAPPTSATLYLDRLEKYIKHMPTVSIGSLHGRLYAMDRDEQWERTLRSYTALTQENCTQKISWQEVIAQYYAKNITDEYIAPTQLEPHTTITDGDAVIFVNIRADRARQLFSLLCNTDYSMFTKQPPHVYHPMCSYIITGVSYHTAFNNPALCKKTIIKNTLCDALEAAQKTIFTIAEKEKYAHVTYFFNGERETQRTCETRTIIPSLGLAHYDKHPEMSAQKIADAVITSLNNNPADFYLINFANADMVGHSGNFKATITAIQFLDKQLEKIVTCALQLGGTIFITGDHGKAESMWDYSNNQVLTQHTTNPVPFIMITPDNKKSSANGNVPLAELSDIAPYILRSMHLPVPPEML